MSQSFLALTALLEGGGLHVMVPLLVILVITGAILVERLSYFGWSFLDWIVPALRRQKAEGRRRFTSEFEAYLSGQEEDDRRRLLETLDAVPPAVRRFVAPLLGGAAMRPGELAELRVNASELLSRRELRRAVGLLPSLAVAALLLGLLASLGALSRTLDELAVHGMRDLTAWSTGLQRTLLGAEASLAVAGLALLASVVLTARVRALEQEVQAASLQWRRTLRSRSEEVPS